VSAVDDVGALCAALAPLFAYPRGDVRAAARRAVPLAAGCTASSAALERFAARVEAESPTGLEELYTATFDLRPACAPYLGAQLLPDDSPVRGALLAALAEQYVAHGFEPEGELADHVAVVLEFLARAPPGPVRDDLLQDGLLPALSRMAEAFEDRAHPYRDLVQSAFRLLSDHFAAPAAHLQEACP
jgi:nitrate reductase delta subunit